MSLPFFEIPQMKTKISQRQGSFNAKTYEIAGEFEIPMPIARKISVHIPSSMGIFSLAGLTDIATISGEVNLGPESNYMLKILAKTVQKFDLDNWEDDLRRLIIMRRSKLPHKQVLDILLSKTWDIT